MNLYNNLPGNWNSMSRFVRAIYVRNNAKVSGLDRYNQRYGNIEDNTEKSFVNLYFRMLDSVSQIRGCNQENDRGEEITIYSCCQDLDKGIYYYTIYQCREIKAISFDEIQLNDNKLKIRENGII